MTLLFIVFQWVSTSWATIWSSYLAYNVLEASGHEITDRSLGPTELWARKYVPKCFCKNQGKCKVVLKWWFLEILGSANTGGKIIHWKGFCWEKQRKETKKEVTHLMCIEPEAVSYSRQRASSPMPEGQPMHLRPLPQSQDHISRKLLSGKNRKYTHFTGK